MIDELNGKYMRIQILVCNYSRLCYNNFQFYSIDPITSAEERLKRIKGIDEGKTQKVSFIFI